jgi:hypothetical protein
MFANLFKTFYIVEYAPRDTLGRTRDWCYWGLAEDEDDIARYRDEIESQYASVEIRAHPYSHINGSAGA